MFNGVRRCSEVLAGNKTPLEMPQNINRKRIGIECNAFGFIFKELDEIIET